jgi:ketosteroid isomerase-like protein
MKTITTLMAALLFAGVSHAQTLPSATSPVAPSVQSTAPSSQAAAAANAFRAWEKGESTGNYADFRAALSADFSLFSHPVQPARGVFRGLEAREKMNQLIDQRSQNPNQLKFANVRQHQTSDSFVFEFDSEGKVSGFPYKGWNAIALTIGTDGRVTGFREYLGDIDPAWFQKR